MAIGTTLLALAVLGCRAPTSPSALPETFPSDTGANEWAWTPGDVCDDYPVLQPSWDSVQSPCELLEGLVFQTSCTRIGFLHCTYWEYAFSPTHGDAWKTDEPYHCLDGESGLAIVSVRGVSGTFDPLTATWQGMDLVGEDLDEDFARWFPELVNRYENADSSPGTVDGGCP
jgi:hypothetical protein